MLLEDPGSGHHRRDAQRTQERILEVARCCFARHGYDGTTVREVASEAGVAPNLITRYFGSKAGLFRRATTMELGVPAVLPGPWEQLGRRIAAGVVARWESASAADPLLMMMRSAGTSDEAAEALATFFLEQASRPMGRHIAVERGCGRGEAAARAAAVGAVIMGVVMQRYVMRSGPLSEADAASTERWLAECLQRVLDDPCLPPLRRRRRPAGHG